EITPQRQKFITLFSLLLNEQYIDEKLAKQIITENFSFALQYKNDLTWVQYLYFLIKACSFTSCSKLIKNTTYFPDLDETLTYFNYSTFEVSFNYENKPVVYSLISNTFSIFVSPNSPMFIFDNIIY